MSATEEDRAYYAAAEAAFIRRRGTPFLLSPTDFALLKQWRALGIPIEAVAAGIDDAFTRREERRAVGRVNSLSYCRDAVLEAWERRAEAARGRGDGSDRAGGDPDPRAALAALAASLDASRARRPDLAGVLDAALASLSRLSTSGKTPEEAEASLARLDRKLARELYEALPEDERAAVDREVKAQLGAALERMDAATAEKTTRALTRRAVRERLDLPRLSLL
ncbi:MAG TPA: hypothetical protein VMH79_08005 [Thermoanaerobaculia bacterium]|nr:hypothetical protein [Thermoanaerobaculia bacterium]